MATPESIAANLVGVKAQLSHFIRFGDGPSDGLMLNNADWLREWGYIDFLRDVGRHFSVNQMLTRDSVKSRMETGLSFIEFNYMILQAYDFMVLNRDHGCRLQMGGNDQWGNICSGIDLSRRVNRSEVYGLTYPLIMTASGEKMGKTAAGAIWLDAARTSPYEFHQYWVNIDDRDVSRFLRLYTTLPKAESEKLETLQGADIREAKHALARAVTTTVHGAAATADAEKAAAALFSGSADTSTVPSSERPAADFAGEGLGLLDALVDAGLQKSKGAARRMIRQGAVRISGEVVQDESRLLVADDIDDGRIVLQVGKKHHHHILVIP
ncbi:MAG: tyrosine--tRNA ligase [Candidatus Krumholzibacteria bacterium]|nr:tyrosine--tRNA ligase [Candidatus Krumholzibacteria bacterium]